jgi:hypothetical protein
MEQLQTMSLSVAQTREFEPPTAAEGVGDPSLGKRPATKVEIC